MDSSVDTGSTQERENGVFIDQHAAKPTSVPVKLPAEIRNRIYHFAFQSMGLRVLPPQGSLLVLTNEQELALLSSCRQIYLEAASLFYQLAEFRISKMSDMDDFFNKVDAKYQPVVRSVAMWWPDFQRSGLANDTTHHRRHETFEQLFPNLEELVVRGTPKNLLGTAGYSRSQKIPVYSTKGKADLLFRS